GRFGSLFSGLVWRCGGCRRGGCHRHDLSELLERRLPIGKHAGSPNAAGAAVMLLDQRFELIGMLDGHLASRHAVRVQLSNSDDVSDAAGHSGARIPADRPEGDGDPTGHVLAEVIARALDHRHPTRVAHAEPLAPTTRAAQLAAGRTLAASG